MFFDLKHTQSKGRARAGLIQTDHGVIETPIFMPVGTVGTVKTIQQYDLLEELNAPIILGNTYHLYLRPGLDILSAAGGLHNFIHWDRPILTDSGGYQVYSLGSQRKIKEEGVSFASHIDGSKHFFTPEHIMDIQQVIGADIIMAFDECTPYPCDKEYAEDSMHLTHRWLDRCIAHFDGQTTYGHRQFLAPIVQGSTYDDLRKQSAEYVAGKDAELNAIGGLSVGEPHDIMYRVTDLVCQILQKDKPRYLMGVGTPSNLLECIDRGIDMFDCVLPTRNARHGLIYTAEGVINIKNAKWKDDFSPLDPNGIARVDQYYTKAYVRHLFSAKEYLAAQITSLHNTVFYLWLMREARKHILNDTFTTWKAHMVDKLDKRL